MKKIKIIGIAVVLIAVVVFAVVYAKGASVQQVSKLDVTDTVSDFYSNWLKAAKDSNASPSRADLAKAPILSKTLRDKLVSEVKNPSSDIDPVLCQTVVPENFSTRNTYQTDTEAQILVTSKDKNVSGQAVFTLTKLNDGWYVNTIECSLGEFAPDKEFSFESEGFLLKDSIPAPYNKKNWHLVYEEKGVQGNVVPLIFDKDSQCIDLDGKKAVCKPDQLTETAKTSIKGQMTEYGVSVKQLQLIKE